MRKRGSFPRPPSAAAGGDSSGASNQALLVNHFGSEAGTAAVAAALESKGWKVRTWARFAKGQSQGRATPKSSKRCGSCLARLPASRGAAEMMLDAAAAVLLVGSPVWVCGTGAEGIGALKVGIGG